jgi:hypothetical protein
VGVSVAREPGIGRVFDLSSPLGRVSLGGRALRDASVVAPVTQVRERSAAHVRRGAESPFLITFGRRPTSVSLVEAVSAFVGPRITVRCVGPTSMRMSPRLVRTFLGMPSL